ncbi:MAG TPA: hypothetical protein VMW48_12010 [Vicinamibacterales bacterium]|nr:hypothetical protein [Vicinamibacterales bacterium]
MVTPVRSALLLMHIWWPLVMGWSLTLVVERATGRTWHPAGGAMLLVGIVAAYSLDRVLDAPPSLTPPMRRTLIVTVAATTLAGVCLLPWLPLRTALLVPVLGALAVGYPAVKRLPFSKALLVPLIWTWSTIALPFDDGSWLGWHWMREPIAAPLFLLIAAGCLLCDLKDSARDRAAGVPSVPAAVGSAAAAWIAMALALTASAVAYVEGRPGVAWGALAMGGATRVPALLATDIVGPLLVDVILTLPGLLIAARLV